MHWRLMVLCLAAASLIASLPVRAEPQPGGNVPASGGGQGACETNPSIPGCKEVIAAADACESDPSLPCRTVDCGAEPSQPACQGVDCSLPANADAPECAIGPDCSVPENAGLPECTDCSDPANAGRPECAGSTVLDDPCTAQDPPPEWCKPGRPQCDPATQDCTSPPFYWRNCSDTAEPCYMYMVGGPVPIMAGGTGPQHGPGPKPSPPAGRPRPPNPDCKCLLLYSPVCGKDGKTYSNACFAGCAKVRSVGACGHRSRGACWLDCQAAKAGCKCGLQWAPTCGADGNVYSNACFAKCKTAVQFACGKLPWGACKRKCLTANCVCPMIYAPVCGMDGRVYESSCQAQCLKQPVRGPCKSSRTCAKDCKAAAKPDCYCPEIYAPVCTKSGQVVANACFAECNKQVIRWPCGSRRDCAKACKAAAAPSACSCTKEVRPVCARSGALFDNPCLARCAKANVRFPCVGMTRSSCSAACKKAAAGK